MLCRTATFHTLAPEATGPEDRVCSIGAGGAIVVQSDPEGEYQEMLLKARSLLRSFALLEAGATPGQARQLAKDAAFWQDIELIQQPQG